MWAVCFAHVSSHRRLLSGTPSEPRESSGPNESCFKTISRRHSRSPALWERFLSFLCWTLGWHCAQRKTPFLSSRRQSGFSQAGERGGDGIGVECPRAGKDPVLRQRGRKGPSGPQAAGSGTDCTAGQLSPSVRALGPAILTCPSDLFHAWPLLSHQALTRPFRCTEDEKQRPAASALGPFTHHSTCLRASTCHEALSEQQSRFEFAGASHRPRKPPAGGWAPPVASSTTRTVRVREGAALG